MPADSWSPEQYERFKEERSRPARDLMALVEPRAGMHVLDLGCGTGELTRQLHERLPGATTLGIDRSANMLTKAAAQAGPGVPGLTFACGDITTFVPARKFDLIFSNAALQWVPGHAALLERLTSWLNPMAGQLAVQIPDMDEHPIHSAAAAMAVEPPFAAALGGYHPPLEAQRPERYAEMLFRLGYKRQNVRLQVYPHVMPEREALIDWIRGTLLTAYESQLPAELFTRFVERYRERLFALIPDERPVLLPYRRVLFWGAL